MKDPFFFLFFIFYLIYLIQYPTNKGVSHLPYSLAACNKNIKNRERERERERKNGTFLCLLTIEAKTQKSSFFILIEVQTFVPFCVSLSFLCHNTILNHTKPFLFVGLIEPFLEAARGYFPLFVGWLYRESLWVQKGWVSSQKKKAVKGRTL